MGRRQHRGSSTVEFSTFERGALLIARGSLMKFLPRLIRHAVDSRAAIIPAELHAALVGRLLEPIRQTVAAEARKVHEIDVLHVLSGAQMLDEPAKCSCLEFRPR